MQLFWNTYLVFGLIMYGYLSTLDDVLEMEKFSGFIGSIKLFMLVATWPLTFGKLIALYLISTGQLTSGEEQEDEKGSAEVREGRDEGTQ